MSDTAATGRARLGDVEIAYRVDGPRRAPVVVLAASLGTTHELWAGEVRALRGRFRVVSFDARGHGASGTPDGPWTVASLGGDLLGLLDALEVGRASICGLSLGAMAAMWVASHAPERVDRLVLASCAPELGPAAPWLERAARVRQKGASSLFPELAARWFTPSFAPRNAALLARVEEMVASCSDEGYARCCEAVAAADLSADVASIRAPTLLVAGAADPVTPPSRMLSLSLEIPGATFVVLPGAAHLANLEQPVSFDAALAGHLVGDIASRGEATRREVLGDAHVDRSLAAGSGRDAAFEDLLTRVAWGELWGREGLDRRTRSAVTIAMLAALGRRDELVLHVAGGVRSGLDRDEIAEILLHAAAYCGIPAANAAFAAAAEAFRALDEGSAS